MPLAREEMGIGRNRGESRQVRDCEGELGVFDSLPSFLSLPGRNIKK